MPVAAKKPNKGIAKIASETSHLGKLRRMIANLEKSAESQGDSSHPTDNAEDGTTEYHEGEHSGELDTAMDVAANGSNIAGDSTAGKTVDEAVPNIGTVAASTGNDPEVDKEIGTGPKEPADTDSPANFDIGEKYSSWSFDKKASAIGKLANEILSDLWQANGSQAAAPAAASATPAAAPEVEKAAQEGYDLASLAAAQVTNQELALTLGRGIVKEAALRADLVVRHLQKVAAGEEEKTDPESMQAAETATGGDNDAAAAGGGEMPPGMEGGMPPGAEGGMPPGAEGGMPPGAEGGGEGGAPSHEEAIAELLQVCEELGVSPEELVQYAPSKAASEHNVDMLKVAYEVKTLRETGKVKIGPVKTARQRALRDEMRNFVHDLRK